MGAPRQCAQPSRARAHLTIYSPTTALIVVDVQNDFADPAGSLFVEGAQEIIGFVNTQIEDAAESGAVVVRTQDWHPPATPHFKKDGGLWPDHCVAESWGAQFHPDLLHIGTVVRKGVDGEDGYSGFTVRDPVSGEERRTGLNRQLDEQGVTNVVVVGLATDYCVKETAIDAVRLGFTCTVLKDGIRAVDIQPGDGDEALSQMKAAGVRSA